jgi:hypothetical protein
MSSIHGSAGATSRTSSRNTLSLTTLIGTAAAAALTVFVLGSSMFSSAPAEGPTLQTFVGP